MEATSYLTRSRSETSSTSPSSSIRERNIVKEKKYKFEEPKTNTRTKFEGFWMWRTEMDRLQQWPHVSEKWTKRRL